ncbi:unnamed protein product [Fraxinus pennsylvanica]|uniref:Uncharacterized protein n=1 Tax=Fraxinus pennsylvanica TaxID=56036 RepID=A0AAD2A9I3_9LAMI|nr:unnamed protein product [Fraxinus pennsylvanica]
MDSKTESGASYDHEGYKLRDGGGVGPTFLRSPPRQPYVRRGELIFFSFFLHSYYSRLFHFPCRFLCHQAALHYRWCSKSGICGFENSSSRVIQCFQILEHKLAEQFQKQVSGAGATLERKDDEDEVLDLVDGETFEAATEKGHTS